MIALAELGERIATHQQAGEPALAVRKPSGVAAVDDHAIVGGPHDVVEQVLEYRVGVSQQDILAGIEIVDRAIDRELFERSA